MEKQRNSQKPGTNQRERLLNKGEPRARKNHRSSPGKLPYFPSIQPHASNASINYFKHKMYKILPGGERGGWGIFSESQTI